MSTSPRTDQEKADLVALYHECKERHGTTQAQFASDNGISERALRSYIRSYQPRVSPHQLQALVKNMVETLSRVSSELDQLINEDGKASSDSGCVSSQLRGHQVVPLPPQEIPMARQQAIQIAHCQGLIQWR